MSRSFWAAVGVGVFRVRVGSGRGACRDPLSPVAAPLGPHRTPVRITSDQVAYVAEHKLGPLGLIAPRDGSPPNLESVNALLALRFRAGIVGERAVNAVARGHPRRARCPRRA